MSNDMNNAMKWHKGITCLGAYTDGKEFWIPSKAINALYYMRILDKKLKYVGMFPDCISDRAWSIQKAIRQKDELFFFSREAYQVWTLNMITSEIKGYAYRPYKVCRMSDVEVVCGKAWIIPSTFREPMIYFDLTEKRWNTLEWDCEICLNRIGPFTGVIKNKRQLYFATRNKNNIWLYIFDCDLKKIFFHNLSELSLINCIGIKGNKLFAAGRDQSSKNVLQVYNLNSMKREENIEMHLMEDVQDSGYLYYLKLIIYQEMVILVPSLAEDVISYHLETRKEGYIEYPDDFRDKVGAEGCIRFFDVEVVGEKVFFMPYQTSEILVFDMKKQLFEMLAPEFAEEEYLKAYQKFAETGAAFLENVDLGLPTFLNLMSGSMHMKGNILHKSNCGMDILKKVQYE